MSYIIKNIKKDDLDKNPNSLGAIHNFQSFFSNQYHTFLVRKTERLASALYVITGFMPQDEPLRNRLRVCALSLITQSSNPDELSHSGAGKFINHCAEIGTILETAQSGGLVSHMNAKLICDEYAALATFARNHHTEIVERGGNVESVTIPEPQGLPIPQRHLKKSPLGFSNSQKTSNFESKGQQSDRKTSILNLFKDKDTISIKDAVASIQGCSEKTIQRDLLAMVRAGVLIKKGERRWSTYQKAENP